MGGATIIPAAAHALTLLLGAGDVKTLLDAASPMFTVAIVLAVTVIIIFNRRRRSRARGDDHLPARELYEKLKKDAAAKSDLEALMLELDELARQLMGRLDSRFAKLEATIRDADQRIDRLNRLVRAQQGQTALDITVSEEGADGIASTAAAPSGPPDPHAVIHRLADEGHSPRDIAVQVGRSTGEVELILSLRRVKGQAAAVSARL